MRKNYTLAFLVELEHLEGKGLTLSGMTTVFLHQVLGSGKTFNAIGQLNHGTLVHLLNDGAFVNASFSEDCFEYVPRILFELLVAKAETTVLLVDFKYNNFHFGAHLSKL